MCKIQIATNRFSLHLRARPREPVQPFKGRPFFVTSLATHISTSKRTQHRYRERERARARDRAREREREREKASPIVYFYAEPCCAYVCVLGQPALFLHFEKKNPIFFLVGWLLAHTPPSFLFLLATHIYITQKMYILGKQGLQFFFQTIYPGLVG